ncbi:MAG: phosphoribosyl-AMP cyclohydrolase [Sneathiella sp.]|nr:MAG: phosphoribosyl-AMP cyclohydrolase [Sneathiella sp.]
MNTDFMTQISFDAAGLVPAIAQQHDTGEVLMMAWMNREAILETLDTGAVCYWSRSRQSLWRKGESSGHTQKIVDFRIDCDGDTILLLVDQKGVACHTGRHNCFFTSLLGREAKIISDIEISPEEMYGKPTDGA